jgi:hypothetical protein
MKMKIPTDIRAFAGLLETALKRETPGGFRTCSAPALPSATSHYSHKKASQ